MCFKATIRNFEFSGTLNLATSVDKGGTITLFLPLLCEWAFFSFLKISKRKWQCFFNWN